MLSLINNLQTKHSHTLNSVFKFTKYSVSYYCTQQLAVWLNVNKLVSINVHCVPKKNM